MRRFISAPLIQTALTCLSGPSLMYAFDSTAPHLYEPSRQNDEVIDMYAACVKPGTDEKYEDELADISKRYKAAVQEGVGFISKAKEALDKLLEIYSAASDPTEIKRICAAVTEKLAV